MLSSCWKLETGTCNIALFSYRYGRMLNAAPPLSWSSIYQIGWQIDTRCVANNEGGSRGCRRYITAELAPSHCPPLLTIISSSKTIEARHIYVGRWGPFRGRDEPGNGLAISVCDGVLDLWAVFPLLCLFGCDETWSRSNVGGYTPLIYNYNLAR